jgi:hypothetical protein
MAIGLAHRLCLEAQGNTCAEYRHSQCRSAEPFGARSEGLGFVHRVDGKKGNQPELELVGAEMPDGTVAERLERRAFVSAERGICTYKHSVG